MELLGNLCSRHKLKSLNYSTGIHFVPSTQLSRKVSQKWPKFLAEVYCNVLVCLCYQVNQDLVYIFLDFPVMCPSGLRSDFCEIWIWGPNPLYSRNFLSNCHLPVHTQRSSSWEEEHSEIQSNRKKKPKPTKPNRGNRRILFPLISDFQKEENAPLGIFRQLHPQTQRCCLSHREFFFKFSLCIFTYFHLPPERSEISSEQFLLPAHSIKKYVAVMTAHRR